MFAIVQISGKQYVASPKEKLVVDSLDSEVGKVIVFSEVMLVSEGEKTNIGTPYLKNYQVHAKVISQDKGEKIDVQRYKSKVRYRRHIGFRPMLTTLEVESIGLA